MAIVATQRQRKQRNLIFVFLIVILISSFVLWKGFFQEEKIEEFEEEITEGLPAITMEDFNILKNPIFGKDEYGNDILLPFESITISEATDTIDVEGVEPGRENPFLPY